MQNPTSVLYFHPYDNTSLNLVLNPLNGTGYADRKHFMVIRLTAKKMAFMDDSLPNVSTNSPNSKPWEHAVTWFWMAHQFTISLDP